LPNEEIQRYQSFLVDKPIGDRIAFWAEKFVGIPYDMDPLGEYVSKATLVADERVDCMYMTFRAVELALSNTPEEATQIALEKRFRSKGILQDGKVMNYEDRFEYGEDMIWSGKWGKDVTSQVGKTLKIKNVKRKDSMDILSSEILLRGLEKLRSGDIIFFINDALQREKGEIVGHIGIIKVEQNLKGSGGREVYIIHASGTKEKGGEVKKVLLKDYISKMPFIGAKITRFH
jgi:hypothetical protein